ncbi:TadE/TadG family type IV pilus assembly protein [Litorimonas haliclonae]|uniref:TadE/TadG family type IV pilus assembly protein n=1 Tax=Litorimonas haliclonae TaxID=2081977 RepID=UPI0039F0CD82
MMFKTLTISSMKSRFLQGAAKIRQNDDGLAAIEFAILAPLLIAMYLGLAEVATAVSTDRSVSHATNVIGDLASQTSNVDKADLEDVLSATLRIMDVGEASKVTIQLDSWSRNSSGKNELVGSAIMNEGSAALPSFDPATIDESLLNENAGILVARVAYKYSPLKLLYMKRDITLSDSFVLKPRRSDVITFGSTEGKKYTCTGTGRTVSCS